jgi:uncharacterized protein (DUF302 family)
MANDRNPVATYSKRAKFEDVRDDLKLYADAQAFVFCSAALSRRTMEADPANVAMCPYSIVVYETAAEPGKVYVSYRRPWRRDGSAASKAALTDVDKLLEGIAREALGMR